MIVNIGLGDSSSDFVDSSGGFDWTFYAGIGIAAFLVFKVLGSKKQVKRAKTFNKRVTRKRIIGALDKKVPKRKLLSQREAKGIFGDIL